MAHQAGAYPGFLSMKRLEDQSILPNDHNVVPRPVLEPGTFDPESRARLRRIFCNHSLRCGSSPCTLLFTNQQKVDKRVGQALYGCKKNLLGHREQLHNIPLIFKLLFATGPGALTIRPPRSHIQLICQYVTESSA